MRRRVTTALVVLILLGLGAIVRCRFSNEPAVYDEFAFWGDEE